MRRGLAAALGVLTLGACGGISGALTFDDSVEIVVPAPMEVVSPPFKISWTGDLGSGEAFAVFVDRDPITPGRAISAAFEDACEGVPDCPDDAFLSARGVYVTAENELDIPFVGPRGGVDGAGALEVHRVTIVVVDEGGVRLDERAWTTEFRINR